MLLIKLTGKNFNIFSPLAKLRLLRVVPITKSLASSINFVVAITKGILLLKSMNVV